MPWQTSRILRPKLAMTLATTAFAACATARGPARERACQVAPAQKTWEGDTLVYTEAQVTTKPWPRQVLRLRYPDELRRGGISGAVFLAYVVDRDGFVETDHIRVMDSTHPGFIAPALEMIQGTQYCPGARDGRPVRVLVRQVVRFNIVR